MTLTEQPPVIWPSHWIVEQRKPYLPNDLQIPVSDIPHETHKTLWTKAKRYGITMKQILALYYGVFEIVGFKTP